MVSEDSQHVGWLPKIHRLSDLRDLDETGHGEVPTELDQLDDPSELREVVSLRGSEWVLSEERNDHIPQVSETGDVVAVQMFAVVVVPPVDGQSPTAEEPNHVLQDVSARCSLYDDK